MASSSDSDERSRKHRKRKKKKTSSSRSRSRSYESRISTKHKKSSKAHKKRSDSRNRERRKSRSPSSSSRRSRERRKSRSRSSSSRRRAVSKDRSRRRRSRSRDRRRRSSSSSERRSPVRERRRRRSRSAPRRRSVSRSRSGSASGGSYRGTKRQSPSPPKGDGLASELALLTPAEQNKVRMQTAIEKAMASDDVLQQIRLAASQATPAAVPLTQEEAEKRRKQIEEIESEHFKRRAFKTGVVSGKAKAVQDPETAVHDSAMFGSTSGTEPAVSTATVAAMAEVHNDSALTHPLLFGDPEARMNRWVAKLEKLRKEYRGGGSSGTAPVGSR